VKVSGKYEGIMEIGGNQRNRKEAGGIGGNKGNMGNKVNGRE